MAPKSPKESGAIGRAHRALVGLLLISLLVACGFQLRQAPAFAFDRIHIAAKASPFVADLRRQVLATGRLGLHEGPAEAAPVVLDLTQDLREKVVVGVGASGQVREFQLRVRLKFRARTGSGRELIPETEMLLTRDISFSETAALAKEAEDAVLYRDMQMDAVQQLMRRLAAITPDQIGPARR